jgi:hypothetical protein
MSNVSIFKNQVATTSNSTRALSDLAKSLAPKRTITTRRIQTNTNGTFKRLINGEVVGNAVRGEINVIILALLPKVSRTFYKDKFDPNKEATLPDCWSNLGDKPEASAPNPQHSNCADCPMNIKGSGDNGSRACKFQRRIAVLVEGDPTGEVYQFNVPAKSLFGAGTGNVHPFESYIKYLIANAESPDRVVTNIKFDDNADTMELVFSPVRNITDAEYDLVAAAQAKPETNRYTMLTVAQASGVNKAPPAENTPAIAAPVADKVTRSEEPDDVPPPFKREVKKTQEPPKAKPPVTDVINAWADDE